MTFTQISRVACSLLIGIHFAFISISTVRAQVEPPPGQGTPSGTVGGGSRS